MPYHETDDLLNEGPDEADLDDALVGTTRRCPECDAEVYADADRCPICGTWIDQTDGTWAGRPWWWVLLAAAGIVAVVMTYALR